MNEELSPPESPRRGRKPSEIAKRDKLNKLIATIRDQKSIIKSNQK